MPSNGVIAKIAIRDFDLLFEDQTFENCVIAKIVLCNLNLLFKGQNN